MCEICSVEPGNCEILVNEEVSVTVGRRKLESHLLSFVIECNVDGTYILNSEYFIDGGDSIASTKLPINYCPFCGRELKRETKVYPWNT